jgi:hypothetical protein
MSFATEGKMLATKTFHSRNFLWKEVKSIKFLTCSQRQSLWVDIADSQGKKMKFRRVKTPLR